jgi:hypothetical protein
VAALDEEEDGLEHEVGTVGSAALAVERCHEGVKGEAIDEGVDGASEGEEVGREVRLDGEALRVEVVPGGLEESGAEQAFLPGVEIVKDEQGA